MSLIKQQPAFNEDYARVSDELAVLNRHESPEERGRDGEAELCFDFGLVYASQTFAASLEGQVCVLKGDSLEIIDDSNSYWWLVKCVKTSEIGYIPAEIVETPLERLARINKNLNVALSQVQENDLSFKPICSSSNLGRSRSVVFDKNWVHYIEDRYANVEDGLFRKTGVTAISKVLMNKFLPYRMKLRKPRYSSGESVERECSIDSMELPCMSQATAMVDVDNTEPISVLRVYAGNTDLKATFKTVNFDKLMTAGELLRVALQRFKVPLTMESSYYLGVLHMDSQKKRLKNDDIVYEVFESLRSKHLPGVSGFTRLSRVVNKHGLVSRVLMSDDNIIRVIINKEDAVGSNKVLLARIFVRHEGCRQAEEYVYKTLALSKTIVVSEAVALALKKFRIQPSDRFVSNLYQKTGEVEVLLQPDDVLGDAIQPQKDVSENLFVLAIRWAGEGPEPNDLDSFPLYSFSSRKSLATDINDILSLKPDFLDDTVSQQSPTVELDSRHQADGCADRPCDSRDCSKIGSTGDHNLLRSSLNGLFNSMRVQMDARTDGVDSVPSSHQHDLEHHWSIAYGNDSEDVESALNYEISPAIKAVTAMLDTCNRASSSVSDSSLPHSQKINSDNPLTVAAPAATSCNEPAPRRESCSPNLDDLPLRVDDNLQNQEYDDGNPEGATGTDPAAPSNNKCFKHSSTPLPDSTESLKPPVRKDSNVANLSRAFGSISMNSDHQGSSSDSGIKMKKRSKSFDAMERYLEEMMSGSCQSNVLSELEIKLKMATIENGSDS